ELGAAATLTVIATVVGVTGGFAGVISYFVSHSIRSWNRFSVVLAFLALLAVGKALGGLRPAMARRGLGVVPWAAALAAILVVATLDQTGHDLVPPYTQLTNTWNTEAT